MRSSLAALLLLIICGSIAAALGIYFSEPSALAADAGNRPIAGPVAVRAASFGYSYPFDSSLDQTEVNPRTLKPGYHEPGFSDLSLDRDNKPFSASLDAAATRPSSFGQSMPSPILSFDGIANLDNGIIYGLLFLPPDMTGDVGPNHYVQAVNALFRVFDRSGVPVTPPIKLSTLFAPLNTVCSTRFDGLPNVLYDPLADRWLISQVCSAFPPFRQLIAISKTGDPTGEYFAYEFVMPNVRINDFPKFGVWHNGYYMTTDEFLGAEYVGSGMFAFDRKRMLAGDPNASYIYFNQSDPASFRRRGMLPSDLDGLREPPDGSPNIFASFLATEYGDAVDAITLYDFRPNFDAPMLSTFEERPESPLIVPAFDPTSPDGRPDIQQPPPGERLDSQSDRLAHRLAYRNQSSHRSLLINQTVRMTPPEATYRAGIRLYELRDSAGEYVLHSTETLGDTVLSRWIGSAAQDHRSNVAVGYNVGSEEKRVSINYSGRGADDPPGTLRAEKSLIEGSGVQKAFGWRWGEYSGMSVDPVDDCTFWLTNAYYSLESEMFSDFGWLTRIGTFRFAECEDAPRGLVSGTVIDRSTKKPIAGANIQIRNYSRTTADNGTFGPAMVLPDTYEVVASAFGYRNGSRSVVVPNGPVSIDIELEPVPVATESGNEIITESCAINGIPEPDETVSVSISIANEGPVNAINVTGELVGSEQIAVISAPQSYGAIAANSEPVARTHTFRVRKEVECGSPVRLQMLVRDEGEVIGEIELSYVAGSPITIFAEDFDAVAAPTLPSGWATSTTTNHQLWRASIARSESPPNSAFSPAPIQVGVNELVSPPIDVETNSAELKFRNWYELETTFLRNRLYDGSVLEIKKDEGEWQDIIAAGGTFLSGGYDGTIDTCCSNPLGGRQGWSGRSGNGQTSVWIDSRVRLPSSSAGRKVRLRWRIGTDIGTFREGQYIDDITVSDGFSCSCTKAVPNRAPVDLDGDGKTDLSLFRAAAEPGASGFHIFASNTGTESFVSYGIAEDIPVPSDFDGDGRADIAVFRPSAGLWIVLKSSDNSIEYTSFGVAGDVPTESDLDGDGITDIAVFRPADGLWFIRQSSTGSVVIIRFGLQGDIPLTADVDGDGRSDIAVFRPSNGIWYSFGSAEGIAIIRFGLNEDIPVLGDYDGDGKGDRAVFRPGDGNWYVLGSSSGVSILRFGIAGDIPLKADFDGDGRLDIAVYRTSESVWYHRRSSDGVVRADLFGSTGELPLPVP